METQTNQKFWDNKKVKIFINQDGKRLIYTATIIEYDDNLITFIDRQGAVYSFNKKNVLEIVEALP